eukprot:TRINITY_DN14119_c0_g1_i3.p1 TRINITY_DN14119_c0_g1~~TRINITY_DN14119_c0_g1_i3.p1  ORF type:complete len:167 (+),score=33.39 TRINITY_DN14119_c0_g1_i3:73-573(+)
MAADSAPQLPPPAPPIYHVLRDAAAPSPTPSRSCGGGGMSELAGAVLAMSESRDDALKRNCGLNDMFDYRLSLVCWRRDQASSWMSTVVDKKRSGNSCARAEQRIILLGPHGFEVNSLGALGIDGVADISRIVNMLSLYGFDLEGGHLALSFALKPSKAQGTMDCV